MAKLVVNALLRDGSTKSYVNSQVAFQLRTHGTVLKIQVQVLNSNLGSNVNGIDGGKLG